VEVKIDWRFAEAHGGRLPELARQLLQLNVDVIVTVNAPAVGAASGWRLQATRTATNTANAARTVRPELCPPPPRNTQFQPT
jgi:hypothetical protein